MDEWTVDEDSNGRDGGVRAAGQADDGQRASGQPGNGAGADDAAPTGPWPAAGALLDTMPIDGGVEGPIVIANEFADVVVSRVHTRNGVRLDIWSPRRGTRVQLDAVELDCLSYQEPETFSEMLARKPSG